MLTMRSHSVLAPIRTGYELDDVFSVVVPIARTNEITNPSFELATTSWTALAGSIARSTTYQYHGAYSLAVTPTAGPFDGVRYDTVSLVSGTTYAYSCKFRGQAGLKYKMTIETTATVELAAVSFVATGRWQWIYGFYTEISSTTRRWVMRKDNQTSVAPFYIDGVQVEACAAGEVFVTTYIDGDQAGLVPSQYPPAYTWNGTPHASSSSRSGLTRAGGRVIRFKDFGWLLTAIIGLGLATPQNVATEYARLDGGFDDYTRKPSRQFSLMGRFEGIDYLQLRENRGLAALFDRDLVGQDQRMVLMHHLEDPCGNVLSDDVRVLCKYQDGLGGNTNNQYAEETPITFTQYLPYVLGDGEAGALLTPRQTVANANFVTQRAANGGWGALSTGVSGGAVKALVYGLDNALYLGGAFTLAGGVANTDGIAKWNGSAFSALSTGIDGATAVLGLAVDRTGALYAGGSFLTMSGVANTARIAKWDGSVWTALSTGANGTVNAVATAPDGSLYIGGAFTLAGGVANTVRIAKWTGSAWVALGTGAAGGDVNAIVVMPDGTLYATGAFTSMGGVANTAGIAYWNGSAWVSVGNLGGTATGYALVVGPDNSVYVAGAFSTAGGVTVNNIARWNGVVFTPLGTGFAAGSVRALEFDAGGILHVAGVSLTITGIPTAGAYFLWTGAAWLPGDVAPENSFGTQINTVSASNGGALTIGFETNTLPTTAAALTTITNIGTGKAYPTITISDTAFANSLYLIVNVTTGRGIYFNYRLIGAGDGATLTLTPDALSFISAGGVNLSSAILPGSNEADFFLQPGANVIAVYSTTATDITMAMRWRPTYVSLDDVP